MRAGNYPSDDGSFEQTISGPSADGVHTIRAANSVGQTVSKTFTTPICAQIGTVDEIEGSAEVTHADGTSGPLAAGDPLKKDDTITVGAGGRVKLLFNDQTTFVLSSGTKLTLDQYVYNPATHEGSTFTDVLTGAFQYVSGLIGHTPDPDNQQIDVVYGSIGIRGTTFITKIGIASAEVDLLDGTVDVSPFETLTTTSYTGPIRIVFDTHGSIASPLTQEQYEAIRDGLFPPVSSDSTPPQVTVTFPSAPAGQSGFFNASQAPVTGGVTAADASSVTAISCGDSLGGLSSGAVNGLNTSSASAALSLSGDGSHVVNCTATDGANNGGVAMGSSNAATVKIDATGPTVSYSAHPATYAVDQTVAITCSAADALSGLVSNTCQNVSGPAYSFSLGLHTYSATATDKAGNSTVGSTQFTVAGTYDGLIALVNLFETKSSVAATMVSTLRGAQAAANSGNAGSANKQLSAFVNQVQAQSGKSLTAEQASILIRLATALKT